MQTHSSKSQPTHFFMNPLEELIALNIKTMQNLSYINPSELSHFQPERILEKNVDVMIDNSHILLDYMHEVFLIAESNLLSSSKEIEKKAQGSFRKAFSKMDSLPFREHKSSHDRTAVHAASSKKSARKTAAKSKARNDI